MQQLWVAVHAPLSHPHLSPLTCDLPGTDSVYCFVTCESGTWEVSKPDKEMILYPRAHDSQHTVGL
jgi:hypothetical protein